MKYSYLNWFRSNTSLLSGIMLTVAAMLSFGSVIAAITPVQAATSSDYRCTKLLQQARDAVEKSESKTQKRAKRYIAIGVQLCQSGNERAASKKFRAALKTIGTTEIQFSGEKETR